MNAIGDACKLTMKRWRAHAKFPPKPTTVNYTVRHWSMWTQFQ